LRGEDTLACKNIKLLPSVVDLHKLLEEMSKTVKSKDMTLPAMINLVVVDIEHWICKGKLLQRIGKG
jgi:hypothetical protein